MLSWGAFVNIAEGVDGLVHISRVSDDRVEDLESILSPGDKVQVRIEEVDLQKGTLALAMNTYRDPSTLPPRRTNDDGDTESTAARRARDPQAGFGGQRLVTMLGVCFRKRLQPCTVLTSSSPHTVLISSSSALRLDMSVELAPCLEDNTGCYTVRSV